MIGGNGFFSCFGLGSPLVEAAFGDSFLTTTAARLCSSWNSLAF